MFARLGKNFKKPQGGVGCPPCTSEGYEKIQLTHQKRKTFPFQVNILRKIEAKKNVKNQNLYITEPSNSS